MFDIGFWELATLGVIGLIVLGPERLPVVARTLGRWVGRARHYVNALTSELEKEVAASEIRDAVRDTRERIESETRDIGEDARGIGEDARAAMAPLDEPIEGRPGAAQANAESSEPAAGETAHAAEPASGAASRSSADSEPVDSDGPAADRAGAGHETRP